MKRHIKPTKERLDNIYILFGISADIAQLTRAYLRGDSRGVNRNINQMIKKLQKIKKIF